jgi:tRNA-binding protein
MSIRIASTAKIIDVESFSKVFMTIGRVNEVRLNESAKIPAYLIQLVFSPSLMSEHFDLSKKSFYTSSAQLVSNHCPEDIRGNMLLSVINFPRKQIGKVMSDCLVTGVQKELMSIDAKRETTVFMRPSREVLAGSRVDILPELVGPTVVEANPRNLSWPEFMDLDLRIAEVEGFEILSRDFKSTLLKVKCMVNLGEMGRVTCMAAFSKDFDIKTLLSRQILVLINLKQEQLSDLFEIDFESQAVALTVEASAVLEPAKRVEPGFKLA